MSTTTFLYAGAVLALATGTLINSAQAVTQAERAFTHDAGLTQHSGGCTCPFCSGQLQGLDATGQPVNHLHGLT